MDDHSLEVLEYSKVKDLLTTFASSDLARQVIRNLRPSADAERLRLSLAQVDEGRGLKDRGHEMPLRGLRDVVSTLRTAHGHSRALEPHELLELHAMLRACAALKSFFATHAVLAPRLNELAQRILSHDELEARIDTVVEPPGVVRDRASPRLWDLRRKMRVLEDQLRDLMVELTQKRYRHVLQDNTFSLRNGRYVLPVKLDRKGHVPGILIDKSASGETAFIEPREVTVLSNELAEVRVDEGRETTRLLFELSQAVYHEERRVAYSQDVAAWLDFTAARARMSAAFDLRGVPMSSGTLLRLRSARHPLLVAAKAKGELAHDVVPLSLTLGDAFRMVVVTGPNTGGKTVALKTAGLIQLMFQSGLHVPVAAGTELPCLSGVFADIGDEQSISQNLSTFSGHIHNIVRILAHADARSLVLLDELGAGTDPSEGSALGQSLLDRLLETGMLVAVTTHLGSLKGYAFSRASVENACVTFDPATLEPTYELVVGQPGASQALTIAKRHGMPEALVDRARGLVERESGRAAELMDDLMKSRVAAERSREKSVELVAESRRRLDEAEQQLGEAAVARARVETEAESEVARVLDAFAQAARRSLNALKNVPKALVPHVDELDELVRTRVQMTPFATRRREFVRELKKHDAVYVPRFGQVCRVEKLNRRDERLVVRVGALSMEIGFDDVSWVTPPDPGATPSG